MWHIKIYVSRALRGQPEDRLKEGGNQELESSKYTYVILGKKIGYCAYVLIYRLTIQWPAHSTVKELEIL